MVIYEGFQLYKPNDISKKDDFLKDVLFLKTSDGTDWYDCQSEFSNETLKIAFDKNGVIRTINEDVSMIWPINMSVAEVKKDDAPRELFEQLDGDWIFDGEKIIPRVISEYEVMSLTEKKRAQLMIDANQKITPLQDASDLGIATEDELERLKVWKTYRVLLNRVEIANAPDIDWPQRPDVQ